MFNQSLMRSPQISSGKKGQKTGKYVSWLETGTLLEQAVLLNSILTPWFDCINGHLQLCWRVRRRGLRVISTRRETVYPQLDIFYLHFHQLGLWSASWSDIWWIGGICVSASCHSQCRIKYWMVCGGWLDRLIWLIKYHDCLFIFFFFFGMGWYWLLVLVTRHCCTKLGE